MLFYRAFTANGLHLPSHAILPPDEFIGNYHVESGKNGLHYILCNRQEDYIPCQQHQIIKGANHATMNTPWIIVDW